MNHAVLAGVQYSPPTEGNDKRICSVADLGTGTKAFDRAMGKQDGRNTRASQASASATGLSNVSPGAKASGY